VLGRNDVLVIDEAGMVGTKQLERMLAAAQQARAKVVLVGDPEQLQAIEAGAAFRGVISQAGMVELTQVRRQKEDWAREATQQLANGHTAEALRAYESRGAVVAGATREEAQQRLLAAWSQDRHNDPQESRLILAYTREAVGELNTQAREILKEEGTLTGGQVLQTSRGAREFAPGDRILFLKNEKSLGVKNGTLGTVERLGSGALQVRLDGQEEVRVAVETKDYTDFDHGYASTVHKSQGATVDRSYVLASRYFDRHSSYVALSRHRNAATLYYAQDEFSALSGSQSETDPAEARRQLEYTLSRARPKELAHDYLDPATEEERAERSVDNSQDAVRRRAIETWKAMREKEGKLSAEQVRDRAIERWRAYRQGVQKSAEKKKDHSLDLDDD
jgi:Ti-type conjugative transfer relaxase TraA